MSRTAPKNDKELVRRLLDGDEDTFTWLVTQYHGQLSRLARVFVSSQGVADEVVQETWLAVLNGLSGFQGRSSLKTWIFRILTNRAKTRGVREGRSVPFSALGEKGNEESAVDVDRFLQNGRWSKPPHSWGAEAPEKLLLDQEAGALMEAAIEELPANQRAVIVLRDVQGWTSKDVCELLDVSETNQRVLLHRARSKVRKALEQYVEGKG